MQIAGSLWSVPVDDRLDTALRLRDAGLARLHWDTTDGSFAAAGGFSPESAAELAAATGLTAEAHLMAHRTAGEVDAWTAFCDLVIVHIESDDWQAALDRIERRGAVPGLAVSPQTPADSVPSDIAVLCMSIVPGQAGSTFDTAVLDKLTALRTASPERRLGVDGGVRRIHAEALASAGADWAVVGTDLVFDREGAWADLLDPRGSAAPA
jgi:pentose-5-phosphate-3-epimerase